MSTTSTSRVLRSASKARSDAGVGPSVGAPHSIAAARSTRGRGSRRAASPAVTANAPDEDVPELNPASNRAYGTAGKPANVQHQSARLGMSEALDGINQAVLGAEAVNGRTQGDLSGLAAVDEEDEGSSVGAGPLPDTFPSHEAVTHWAARVPPLTPGNRVPLSQGPGNGYGNVRATETRNKWIRYSTDVFNTVKLPIAIMILSWLLALGLMRVLPSKNLDINSASDGTIHSISSTEYNTVQRRLDHIEQQLQSIPRQSVTSCAPPVTQHRINWFTPGFGAYIDVELSSPTAAICDPTWKPWPLGRFFKQACPELPLSPPQKMALQTWEDPTLDRWCAPRSGGKLQLTIEISRNISPYELVVEYMAREASPTGYMNSAPREFELWARIEDVDERARVSAVVDEQYPEFWQDSNSQGRVLLEMRDLGEEYVPIGRWEYNMWQRENVQGFKIPRGIAGQFFSTDKLAIRVNSNWGNVEFTCINRLGMYGTDKSGMVDHLEDDPSRKFDQD